MEYQRISPLPADFSDVDATSVESLRDAWVEQRSGLADGGALAAFNEQLIRRWAIETGIVERLYSIDRGTTELLVSHGLDVALIEHGSTDLPAETVISILKDHREAAGYVVDHVAKARPLTEHFIRSIHALLTSHQDFVEAEDQFGHLISTQLLKGQWKAVPNNPRRPDGTIYRYCPPELVQEEIASLLHYYRRMTEEEIPAVTRAAWLHHRFTQIHPFQDGNGRVARALTALVFVAADCFPIVVDRDIRDQYIGALEDADAGDIRQLVRLFSLLQRRELETALSMSEDMLVRDEPRNGSLRAKLLDALRDRAKERRRAITARREEVLEKGHHIFWSVIVAAVNELAGELDMILKEELPGSNVRVEVGDASKKHFFKMQMVQIAQEENYYGDFETTHEWIRLRIQRPGESEADVNEIVISMHSLGRHFTGVLVVSAYFAKRFLDESGRSITLAPHRLAERSLTFSYREEEANISSRMKGWIDSVLDMGLAEFQKTL